MTGDVGSGLVPGLKGYGVSNRLPREKEKHGQTKGDERKMENDKGGMNMLKQDHSVQNF